MQMRVIVIAILSLITIGALMYIQDHPTTSQELKTFRELLMRRQCIEQPLSALSAKKLYQCQYWLRRHVNP
jgi:hypothetical protein